MLAQGSRKFPGGLGLHRGVLDRIAGGDVVAEGHPPAPYKPSNLAGYLDGQVAAAGVVVVA